MLIGQVGRLDFGHFIAWCGPPTLVALAGSYLLLCGLFRREFGRRETAPDPMPIVQALPRFDRWQSVKGVVGVGLMLGLFFSPIPRELSAIAVAGVLLCSRRLKSREILQLVDWHLITLFCSLFVTIGSIANLIVIEQAALFGVDISFRDHARAGIPVTLFSLLVLAVWIPL